MSDVHGRLDTDHYAADAAPYVLGALTEPEHEAFSRHLRSCVACREEVAALAVIADALPAAAPRMSVPPALKGRVMAGILADRGASYASAQPRARRQPLAGLPKRPVLALGAFAASAAAVVLAVLALSGGGSSSATRVISAEVLLHGARAAVQLSGGHAQLDISGMPQAAPQRVYEVWVKRSGPPQPTDALFTVTSGGRATVGVPGSVSGVRTILVTSEPLGGSRVPTSPALIIAHLG